MRSKEVVKQKILSRIESGRYPEGSRIDPVSQLTQEFGVSPVTVTLAIRDLVEEGVLRTQPRVGCFVRGKASPGETPSPSRTGASRIGILLPFLEGVKLFNSGPLSDALRSVQSLLYSEPYAVEIIRGGIPTGRGIRPPFVAPETLAQGRFAGLIAIGFYDLGYLRTLRKSIPVLVTLDVDASAVLADSVFFDNARSAAELTRMLYDEGRRRIAYIGGESSPLGELDLHQFDSSARERLTGWQVSMTALGLEPDPSLVLEIPRGYSGEGPDRIARFLRARETPPPDAIVTEMPEQLLRGFARAGMREDEIPYACWVNEPAPSHVRHSASYGAFCDLRHGAADAVEILKARLRGEGGPVARRTIPVPVQKMQRIAASLSV